MSIRPIIETCLNSGELCLKHLRLGGMFFFNNGLPIFLQVLVENYLFRWIQVNLLRGCEKPIIETYLKLAWKEGQCTCTWNHSWKGTEQDWGLKYVGLKVQSLSRAWGLGGPDRTVTSLTPSQYLGLVTRAPGSTTSRWRTFFPDVSSLHASHCC